MEKTKIFVLGTVYTIMAYLSGIWYTMIIKSDNLHGKVHDYIPCAKIIKQKKGPFELRCISLAA